MRYGTIKLLWFLPQERQEYHLVNQMQNSLEGFNSTRHFFDYKVQLYLAWKNFSQ